MRDLEQELIDIEKEHNANKALINKNTIDLFEKCRELIIFHVKKNLILENITQVENIMKDTLVDVVGEKVLYGFDYSHKYGLGIDGGEYSGTMFLSWYFIENKLDDFGFLDMVISHIKENGFNIDYRQVITKAN